MTVDRLSAGVARRLAEMTPSARRIAGVFLIALITLLWYATMPLGILVGDDVGLVFNVLHGHTASTIPQALTETANDKYRPLLNVVFSIVIPLFRGNFIGYEALNIILEIASAVLVAKIVMRLTRGNSVLALAAAVAFVVSRFAYYNILQMQGILEGLSLLLMLLAVLDAADAFVLDRYARLERTVLWYVLVIFTDERYLVMGLFLVACAVLHPGRRAHPRAFAIAAGGAVAALVVNVGIKTLFFHHHVLVGTGGNLMAADPSLWVRFTGSAVANVLGFNVGPDYLSGLDVAEAGAPGYLLGLLVALPALAVFGAYAATALRERRRDFVRGAVIGLALFVPLLLSSAVTIRQEFRWLYAPGALLLIGLAAAAVRAEPRALAIRAAVFVCAASVAGSMYYRTFELNNLFFTSSMGIANGVRDVMLRDPARPVVVADHGDRNVGHWIFFEGEFSNVYGLDATPMLFVREVTDPHPALANLLSVQGAGVARVPGLSGAELAAALARAAVVPFDRTAVSFITSFPKGTINDKRDVATPSRTGALVMPWAGPNGPVPSLTVITGFRYSYPAAKIVRGEKLAFYAGRPYAVGSPTRAYVTVDDGHKQTTVFDEKLPLANAAGIQWKRQAVDLSRFAGRSVVVTFGCEAVGDQTAAWVAFGYPALVTGR